MQPSTQKHLGSVVTRSFVPADGNRYLDYGLLFTTTNTMPTTVATRLPFAIAIVATFAGTGLHAQEKATETATFGGGCYWCVEAVFQRINGVTRVAPGFMGGHLPKPNYHQVLSGRTGHAEVVQIEYDPSVVPFATLLEVFWKTHDPTTKNRQGPDIGTQYRSVIFYHTDDQRDAARRYKKRLNKQHVFPSPVVTQIEKASDFYVAGRDHLDYYNRNPDKQYCRNIIGPKLKKLKEVFADKVVSHGGIANQAK